eukprot:2251059-Pyramimonas_sp.AAC.1
MLRGPCDTAREFLRCALVQSAARHSAPEDGRPLDRSSTASSQGTSCAQEEKSSPNATSWAPRTSLASATAPPPGAALTTRAKRRVARAAAPSRSGGTSSSTHRDTGGSASPAAAT